MLARMLMRQVDARGDFDDFLMPPLHRAIAIPEMDEIAVVIAEDLHFDVLGAADVAFDEDFAPCRRRRRLRAGLLRVCRQVRRRS